MTNLSTFQSTPSVGRATHKSPRVDLRHQHFNPRPPWGGRRKRLPRPASRLLFQSTPSVGRATYAAVKSDFAETFQSTPSVGRATTGGSSAPQSDTHFNPRPPWGGRPGEAVVCHEVWHFNPRPPWGGRLKNIFLGLFNYIISIHALRGEGDAVPTRLSSIVIMISIHALRGEGDF